MNRLLQRFVADPQADAAGHGPPAGHDARDNPQLASLLAPPPRAAVAGGPPRSSGARLYPLPPRSSSGGLSAASSGSYGHSAGSGGGYSYSGAGTGSSGGLGREPRPLASAPPPESPAFFYYQHNPYQYQAQEFARNQQHPAPPPSSSGSQRRGSGNALGGLDEARSTYETVDLNDDARPLPGRVAAPPRSADGRAAAAFFQQTGGARHPPRSTGNAASLGSERPPAANGYATADSFFQQQQQQQQQQAPPVPIQVQQVHQPAEVEDDARSVSDLFASSSVGDQAAQADEANPFQQPQTPQLNGDIFQQPKIQQHNGDPFQQTQTQQNHVDPFQQHPSDLFQQSPAQQTPEKPFQPTQQQASDPFQQSPGTNTVTADHTSAASPSALQSASDLFAAPPPPPGGSSSFPTSNLSTGVPPASPPTPTKKNGTAPSPRPLGIARSPAHKPMHRRIGSNNSMSGIVGRLDARQLALHDQQRGSNNNARVKAMSVDLNYENRFGRSQVTTRDESAKLADMYKQMAERLQGEKQDLLKVVAVQAEQIAALQRRLATLEHKHKTPHGNS